MTDSVIFDVAIFIGAAPLPPAAEIARARLFCTSCRLSACRMLTGMAKAQLFGLAALHHIEAKRMAEHLRMRPRAGELPDFEHLGTP